LVKWPPNIVLAPITWRPSRLQYRLMHHLSDMCHFCVDSQTGNWGKVFTRSETPTVLAEILSSTVDHLPCTRIIPTRAVEGFRPHTSMEWLRALESAPIACSTDNQFGAIVALAMLAITLGGPSIVLPAPFLIDAQAMQVRLLSSVAKAGGEANSANPAAKALLDGGLIQHTIARFCAGRYVSFAPEFAPAPTNGVLDAMGDSTLSWYVQVVAGLVACVMRSAEGKLAAAHEAFTAWAAEGAAWDFFGRHWMGKAKALCGEQQVDRQVSLAKALTPDWARTKAFEQYCKMWTSELLPKQGQDR